MDAFERFKKKQAITAKADDIKMIILLILVSSIFVFVFLTDEIMKSIIPVWAGGMSLLVVIAIIMDLRNSRKIKKLGL